MNSSKALVLLVGLPGLSLAQPCQDVKDDAERLACYDAQDAPAPAAEAPMPSAVPAAVAVPAVKPAPEPEPVRESSAVSADDFGKRESVEAPTQSITATIKRVQEAGNVDYLYLDNGQVWRETGGDSGVRFKKGKTVTIAEGVLGSYDLTMEGQNRKAKVRRVR